ncbi:hypothetical protein [Chromobacterium sp. Beijing]|uniref:hypothetical protein n=1 Tax=Chromobacterium sp. Beijing TaxID=2735795 RepID=UPI001F19ECC2|nr:hypothetical protein [Chromobacterium sp. Beijing]UJB29600.1 hypothetical protein HQN78_04030 [Chromobacterium sp. Beijing]
MKPEFFPLSLPRFQAMSKAEIITHFECYEFRDTLGHPLVNCEDFLVLLDEFMAGLVKP